MNKVEYIVIHCSDSDLLEHDDIKVIDQWHRERGFSEVGYHAFIRKDGTIQLGRKLTEQGAHCKGYNDKSWGICLSGRHNFTAHQAVALVKYIRAIVDSNYDALLADNYVIVPHHSHNIFKTCPNFNWFPILEPVFEKHVPRDFWRDI